MRQCLPFSKHGAFAYNIDNSSASSQQPLTILDLDAVKRRARRAADAFDSPYNVFGRTRSNDIGNTKPYDEEAGTGSRPIGVEKSEGATGNGMQRLFTIPINCRVRTIRAEADSRLR